MSERKNIDRLFQEKFKDFEAAPGEHVWKNIEAALQQKKKERKVIPFWWRLSGVAAALVIGLLITNALFFTDNPNAENQVVTNAENQQKANTPSSSQGVAGQEKNSIVKPAHLTDSPDNAVANGDNSLKSNSAAANKGQAVAHSASSSAEAEGKTKKPSPKTMISTKTETGLASAASSTAKPKTKKALRKTAVNPKTDTGVASTVSPSAQQKTVQKTETAVAMKTKSPGRKKTSPLKTDNATRSQQDIASTNGRLRSNKNQADDALKNNSGSDKLEDKKGIADNKAMRKPAVNTVQEKSPEGNNTIQNTLNNTSGNAVADNKSKTDALPEADKKLDPANANAEPNELEKLLAQQNEKEVKVTETKLNRWQVSSSVAPIYFSSSGGSPLDEEFSGNDKSYENNMSFGVGINYAVNDKLSLRTGVNKLTLGYDTNGVIFYAGLDGQSISNVSQQGDAAFIEVMNQEKFDGLLPFETSLQDLNYGSISQRMGYIEVPVEMSYKLVDNQFGVTLIGGMSTLFLDENKIRVASKTMNANLGKANNLNDVHFSSNIGVGFKYSFLKAFEFNFEPMFKYQLNTFSKDSGNFKPYFIGLYSGVSFKF
ncbi:outer membrane beta-barrel protein [Flavobacterium pallidum]|uniref:Outer membrane protein beta-barrel domain-containing protein n=1 Tax=Flavobacterium pallidum TaxID=2172098 RepID=A0A2S1SF68_9FLAO|nr:outer membrane beta-barrel protein [Flavobacterium pallidum]AWI24987.1 hypothetical protein HYN49_03250 [Flavobacterium pallidum]